jgi:aldose 1-epimerase
MKIGKVTYTLEPNATWNININAVASAETPIMLSGHHYWNLEAYQESQDLNAHYAQFHASRFVATDGNLIPTGELRIVDNTSMDFRKAKSVGLSILETTPGEFCGTGVFFSGSSRLEDNSRLELHPDCVGFDNCWLFDEVQNQKPAFSMWNNNSGIK